MAAMQLSRPRFRRGGFGFGRSRRRRPVEWERALYQTFDLPVGQIAGLALANHTKLATFTNPTITRVIGQLDLFSGDFTTGNLARAAFGIILWEDQVSGAQSTLPNPFDDMQSDWMFWGERRLFATDPPVAGLSHVRVPFDVRAQRKVPSDDFSLWFVLMNTLEGTTPICWSVSSSVLIKE